MDKHIQSFLNRISLIAATLATILLFSIFLRRPESCGPHFTPQNFLRFPTSTCDSFHRPRHFSTVENKNKRIWSTSAWLNTVSSFSLVFLDAQKSHLLSNSSKTLCILAGAGQEVMALNKIGVSDVTAIDLVDSPPLVSRGDALNLPFFSDAFDFAFSAQFDVVLFPTRFVQEMERTVRVGGHCLLVVEECTLKEVKNIVGLFKRGTLVDVNSFTLGRSKMTRITVRITRPISG